VLSPDFSPLILSYHVTVPPGVESIRLNASALVEEGRVSGDDLKTLSMGGNTFEITASASDEEKQIYTVTVFRSSYDCSLEQNGQAELYTPTNFNLTGVGTVTLDVITGYYLYYTLQTGNFSGNLPLHFNLGNGISGERTFAVQPNSLYLITLLVPVNPDSPLTIKTTFDSFGRPKESFIKYTYHLCEITASEGNNFVRVTYPTITGTPTSVTVSDAVYKGSTGITPVETASWQVYPNPVAESFRIDGITAPTQVTVTDLGGRTVLTQTVAGNEPVATGHLPQGIYLVRINGKTVKMIKQ
jgi:hypothetical protein